MNALVTRTRGFVAEVVEEIKKVTWPDWEQLKNSTMVVLVFVVIVSTIIFVMDLIVRNVLGFIINVFSS
jgi:preprotein translocase subunit SecE